MSNETSGFSILGIGLILVGVIAGIAMWEQCDPDYGRKWLSDECYEDYYQNSEGECCKVYPVGATVAFLFFAIPGLVVMSFATGPVTGTGNIGKNTYQPESLVIFDADEELKKREGKFNTSKTDRKEKKIIKKKITKKNNDSLVNELKKLNELKEQGILDEDEFKSAKRKIIGK